MMPVYLFKGNNNSIVVFIEACINTPKYLTFLNKLIITILNKRFDRNQQQTKKDKIHYLQLLRYITRSPQCLFIRVLKYMHIIGFYILWKAPIKLHGFQEKILRDHSMTSQVIIDSWSLKIQFTINIDLKISAEVFHGLRTS